MRAIQKKIFGIVILALFVFAMTSQSDSQTRTKHTKKRFQTAKVLITENGYSRTSINLRRGFSTRITFLRQTDTTCATEIVIADYGINQFLPLNTPVIVSFTPNKSGEVNFTCRMNMMRGKLIVR